MSDIFEQQKHPGYKRWVSIFLMVAIVVHAGVFYLFTVELEEAPELSDPEGFVFFQPEALTSVTDELEQRAFLFDSEPIFLPTTRNYSGPIKTDASIWEPEVTLSAGFDPDIRWDDSLLLMEPSLAADSGSPVELLRPVSRDFISEFGAEKSGELVQRSHGLYIEAKTSDGFFVLKTFIELEDEVEVEFPLKWAEFSVFHNNFGLAGDPLLITPSGNEATDNFVREFILTKVHPLLLGSTGYFHIRIGL